VLNRIKRLKDLGVITKGIIIGSVGGALAGLTVWLLQWFKEIVKTEFHKRRVYDWLEKKTNPHKNLTTGSPSCWISTIEIASYTNLMKDRVRYICSIHKKIKPKLEKDLFPNESLEEKWAII